MILWCTQKVRLDLTTVSRGTCHATSKQHCEQYTSSVNTQSALCNCTVSHSEAHTKRAGTASLLGGRGWCYRKAAMNRDTLVVQRPVLQKGGDEL